MPGQFMWFDLGVTDAGKAREFYSSLFGWAIAPADNAGPPGGAHLALFKPHAGQG